MKDYWREMTFGGAHVTPRERLSLSLCLDRRGRLQDLLFSGSTP